MVLQGLGARMLTRLMRMERAADCDSSWMLHGPAEEPAFSEHAEPGDEAPPFRYAAE